ncbi:hypothetical protein ACFLT2_00675 [Acidobacteriota bacterium]
MAKCVKCSKRKAKRHCPALGKAICNLCCGLHRQKEIQCPPTCSFLAKHKPYQDKRTLEKKHSSRPSPPPSGEDILSDERLAWLAFNIEVPIGRMAERDSSMTDGDALFALDYVRSKLEKESSLVIMAENNVTPKNELGEAIFQSVEQCRFEKKIIIPGELQTYKRDEKIKCLDRVIFAAKQFSGDDMGGRGYLQQLIDRFSKISELSRQQKLQIP